MTTFRIEVVVDPAKGVAGARKVGKELDDLEGKGSKLQRTLARVFVVVGGAALVREIIGMADAWTDLTSRVRIAVGSQQAANETMDRLAAIARRTYSDINLTTESFLLNSTALRELGYNTEQQLDFTEALNNALVVSGAKGERARQVTEALAKAMAFGTLQGDNLNTVIQTGGRVAEALAAGLGVSTNELRKLGAEGKITAIAAVEALSSQMETLRTEAESMPATVADGFTILKNELLEFVGTTDQALGVSASLSAIVIGLAENVEVLAIGVGVLTFAIGSAWVASLITSGTALTFVIAKVGALNALIAANPFGALIVVITGTVAALYALELQLIKIDTEISNIQAQGNKLELTEFGKLGDDILRTKGLLEQAERTLESSGGATSAAGAKVEQYRAKLAELTAQQDLLRNGTVQNVAQAQAYRKALDDLSKSVGDVVAGIEQENTLLQLNSREREIQAALLKEITALNKGEGPDVTEEQKAQIEAALRKNQALEQQAAVLEKIRGPQERFEADLAALNALLASGKISVEEFNKGLLEIGTSTEGLDLSKLGVSAGGQNAGAVASIQAQVAALKEQAAAESARATVLREIQGPAAELIAKQETLRQLLSECAITQEEYNVATAATFEALNLLNPEYAAQQALLQEILGPTQQLEERQRALDALFAQGAITGAQYEAELVKMYETTTTLTAAQQLQVDLLERIKGPQDQLLATQQALNALLSSGAISATEYAVALNEATIAANTLGSGASAGLAAGLAQIENHLLDVGGAVQQTVVNGFRAGEDALVSFVRTGKADFSGLVNQILDDLARLAVQQLLLGLFGGGASGGVTGFLGGLFGGGRAEGGPVDQGKAYVVGERGPEIFAPKHAGNIVPAGETAAMMRTSAQAPTVNVTAPPATVQVINVSDPSEIPKGIESAQGQQAIMNVISRNRRTVKGITG